MPPHEWVVLYMRVCDVDSDNYFLCRFSFCGKTKILLETVFLVFEHPYWALGPRPVNYSTSLFSEFFLLTHPLPTLCILSHI